ncbi:elongation factor 1-gamma [Ganoderma leucocontextum]|nr:elongation factor 1-gamma [Ganoderma leucocontextum]
MASIGTLWTIPDQVKGKTIRAAAALGGLKVDLPDNYVHYQDNKKYEFLSKFPHGKIPAFDGADGFKLFEASAIARYIASLAPNSNLLGSNVQEAALVDQWVSFAECEIGSFTGRILGLVSGKITPYAKPTHIALCERQLRSLRTLDSHLATRTFLVNERISLADLTIASEIQRAMGGIIDAPLRAQIPNVIRHVETVVNQPQLKEIYGETKYLDKALAFTPRKEKEAKPAAAPTPKTGTEKEFEAEEEEDDVPKEPKPKNPLDSLPKSSFNLEDWKRAYSNKDTRGADGSLEWFYQHFDPEGFSVWRVDFKYNGELTQTFMSSNQIGGFFNRLEASRKYLFGSVGVLGEMNDSVISGALVARGQDIKPVVEVAPDYESYAYKRLDLSNADDKVFFEAALAWDLEIDGRKWVDGKSFK